MSLIAQTSTHKNQQQKKKIDDWMDTRTIDSLAEYVLCMQHHRWFNMFPDELLLLSLLLTCFYFVEGNRIFNYSNPFFPFRSTRYRLSKSSQRRKNTQNAGRFVSFFFGIYLFIYLYIYKRREDKRIRNVHHQSMRSSTRSTSFLKSQSTVQQEQQSRFQPCVL